MLFALLMGLLGGFLPAIRAARLNIVDALRAV
jgi:ABC-type antimicrobial peptide transport system permease subunit